MNSRGSALWWFLCGSLAFALLVGLLGVLLISDPLSGLVPLLVVIGIVGTILYLVRDRV